MWDAQANLAGRRLSMWFQGICNPPGVALCPRLLMVGPQINVNELATAPVNRSDSFSLGSRGMCFLEPEVPRSIPSANDPSREQQIGRGKSH